MINQILETKEDIKQFVSAICSDTTRGIKISDGTMYFEVADVDIPESLNMLFYTVLEDLNLNALVVRNTYVICHETIVESVSTHLLQRYGCNPVTFLEMMKGAEVHAA